jgi:hypothetical protein
MKSLFYFFIVIVMFGCVSSESLNNENQNQKRYAFGQGGGFTGDYEEFILNENGKVYKYDFKYDREVYYKDLAKVDLHYFLEKIEGLGLDGVDINQPGNMTSYIDVRIGQNSINKIVWGSHQYYPPKELITFHKEAFQKLSEFE